MEIGFSLRETVEQRISVRGYDGRKVEEGLKERILAYIDGLRNPLGPRANIKLIEKTADGEKLGTYGVIRGAGLFFGATVPREERALEALGYQAEQLVLWLTAQGLGTCWLGGTFNKGAFARAMKVGEDEVFPIISPIGYPAEKKHLLEALMTRGTKRHQRMDWAELFFEGNFDTPLTEAAAGEYRTALELMRLAPSAVNKQPWRVVKEGKAWHFFEHHSLPAKEVGFVDLQRVDVGIGICHFHLTALEQGLTGHFARREPGCPVPAHTDYIVSWAEE